MITVWDDHKEELDAGISPRCLQYEPEVGAHCSKASSMPALLTASAWCATVRPLAGAVPLLSCLLAPRGSWAHPVLPTVLRLPLELDGSVYDLTFHTQARPETTGGGGKTWGEEQLHRQYGLIIFALPLPVSVRMTCRPWPGAS